MTSKEMVVKWLHSPSLVAIGLSVGYETWPPIGWHHPFVIGLNIDWDCLVPHCIMGSCDQWEFSLFQTTVTVPLHCRRLPLRLCNGTVTECTVGLEWDLKIASNIQEKYNFLIITKQGTYVNKCVKSSNWTKFHCSSLKNGFRNDHNAKISNWVHMHIFNELWCWFSKASKVLP